MGRKSRPPIDPNAIIGQCRFCSLPILAKEHIGRRRQPWFHSTCGIMASRFSIPPGVMFSEPAYSAVEPTVRTQARSRGPLAEYMRAWRLRKEGHDVELPKPSALGQAHGKAPSKVRIKRNKSARQVDLCYASTRSRANNLGKTGYFRDLITACRCDVEASGVPTLIS